MEHRVKSQKSESIIQEKAIKIDFVSANASLNRRVSNKEFRISKSSLHHSAVPCSAVRCSVL